MTIVGASVATSRSRDRSCGTASAGSGVVGTVSIVALPSSVAVPVVSVYTTGAAVDPKVSLSRLDARRIASTAEILDSRPTSVRSVRTVDRGTVVSLRTLVPTGTVTQNGGMYPAVRAQRGLSFALACWAKTKTSARSASTPTPATVNRIFI